MPGRNVITLVSLETTEQLRDSLTVAQIALVQDGRDTLRMEMVTQPDSMFTQRRSGDAMYLVSIRCQYLGEITAVLSEYPCYQNLLHDPATC